MRYFMRDRVMGVRIGFLDCLDRVRHRNKRFKYNIWEKR